MKICKDRECNQPLAANIESKYILNIVIEFYNYIASYMQETERSRRYITT